MEDFVKACLTFPDSSPSSLKDAVFYKTLVFDVFVSVCGRTVEVIGHQNEVMEFCNFVLQQDRQHAITFDHKFHKMKARSSQASQVTEPSKAGLSALRKKLERMQHVRGYRGAKLSISVPAGTPMFTSDQMARDLIQVYLEAEEREREKECAHKKKECASHT